MNAPRLQLSPDVLLQLGSQGELLLYHVRARTHTRLCPQTLALLRAVAPGATEAELARTLASADDAPRFHLRDVTREGTLDGLFNDPTNLDHEALGDGAADPGSPGRDLTDTLAWLQQRLILYTDPGAYWGRFALKDQDVDPEHVGNYYQHLTEQLAQREIEPMSFWLNQKFDPDTLELRPSLYAHVQHHYLQQAFGPASLAGKEVLDFGCGPGFYSRFLAERGARVLGLDPFDDYLERAKRNTAGTRCRFRKLHFFGGHILPLTPGRQFDLIWISDTLLFYFTIGDFIAMRQKLLRRLAELLRPGGELVVMEPHGAFWLSPWLGDARHPYTVVSEYAHRSFRVAPTLGELSGALTSAGFVITSVEEPTPDPASEAPDPRGYHFARQFPLWWVLRAQAKADLPRRIGAYEWVSSMLSQARRLLP